MKVKGKISKMLVFFICLAMIISMIPFNSVHADYDDEGFIIPDGTTEDGFLYVENSHSMYVMGYVGNQTEIEIPDYIKDKPVVCVMNSRWRLFLDDDTQAEVTKITIPNTVKKIYSSAFALCDTLEEVYIPDSVVEMGSSAFDSCSNLQRVRLSPNAEIGKYTFSNCESLTSIEIPEGVTSIGEGAFNGCKLLKNIVIPDSVTAIESYAFGGTNIENIWLPKKLTKLGRGAFQNCSLLESIDIPMGLTGIEMYTFDGCSSLKDVTMYWNINIIVRSAFNRCDNLQYVYYIGTQKQWDAIEVREENEPLKKAKLILPDLPDGLEFEEADSEVTITKYTGTAETLEIPAYISNFPVRYIGTGEISAFASNSTVETVIIPNTVKEIRPYAFQFNPGAKTSLKNIDLGDSVEVIGESAFDGCAKLEDINVPDSVKSLGKKVFKDCTSLAKATIPTSMTEVSEKFFSGCTSLEEVKIHKGVKTIGQYAFEKCSALTDVTIPDSITMIDDYAFSNCTALKSIEIPNSVTKIDMNAFNNCTGLESIKLSENITDISLMMFFNCKALKSIEIPEGVTRIGSSAFRGCSALENITLPRSLTNVDYEAFYNCSNIKNVYYNGNDQEWKEIEIIDVGNEGLINAKLNCVHKHIWKLDKVITEADCMAPGEERYICYCGEEKTEVVPALLHDFEETVVDPTCKEIGYTKYVCSLCGINYKALEVAKVDHTEEVIPAVAATCTEPGLTEGKKCSVCGKELLKQEEVPSIGHKYDNSCDADCNVCGVVREIIHTYDNGCDADCNICGEERSAEHAFEWVIDKEASCQNGEKHEECMICHEKRNENTIIEATGEHEYSYDCDEKCNNCPNTRDAKHIYEWKTIVEPTCTDKGKEIYSCKFCGTKHLLNNEREIDVIKHSYDNACDEDCNFCKATRTAPHKYDNACDIDCNLCGITRETEHKYSDVCDSECNYCNYVRIAPHNYVTGYKVTSKASYDVDGTEKATCYKCKIANSRVIPKISTVILDKTEYTYTGKTIKPIVTVKDSAGKELVADTDYTVTYPTGSINAGTYSLKVTFKGTYYTGSVTRSYEIIKPHTCTWDSGTVTKDPTCVEEGVKTYKCTATGCTNTKEVPVATIPHEYEKTGVIAATMLKDGATIFNCTMCGDEKTEPINKISSVEIENAEYTYTGKAINPVVTVKDSAGKKLVNGSDYKITYPNSINEGEYVLTVTFEGSYAGETELAYKITKPIANLAAPSKATAALDKKYNTVKFSWSKVSGAAGYNVYYKTAEDEEYTLEKSTTAVSITKSGLTDGKKYTFKVVPYKTMSGIKAESNKVKTADITIIKAPKEVAVLQDSLGKAKVSWTDIAGESGYEVSMGASSTETKSAGTATAPSKVVSTTDGRTYYYKVRAYVTVGKTKIYGPWSEVVSHMNPLGAATNASAVLTAYNAVKFSWNAVNGANGYTAYYKKTADGEDKYTSIGSTNKTNISKTGLEAGVSYDFKVVAYYKSGSVNNISEECTIAAVSTLGTMAMPEVISNSATQVKVSWADIDGQSGYEVSMNTSATKKAATAVCAGTNVTNKVLTATKGVPYYYSIRPYVTVGKTKIYGPWSDTVKYTLPLTAPTTVKAELSAYNAVKISWSKVSGATGYYVYYKTDSADTFKELKKTTGTSHSQTKLAVGTTYDFKVVPYYNPKKTKTFYKGEESVIVSATTLKVMSPVTVAINDGEGGNIKVSWVNNEAQEGCQISASTTTKSQSIVYTSTSAEETYKVLTIAKGQPYYYQVRSYVTVGKTKIYGPWSTAVKCTDELTAPENMKAVLTAYNAATISWNKVSGASGYYIYSKAANAKTYKQLARITATSYKASGLAAGAEIEFKVVPYYNPKKTKSYYSSVNSETINITTMNKMAAVKVAKDAENINNVIVSWTNTPMQDGVEISQSTNKKKAKCVATIVNNEQVSISIPAKAKTQFYYQVRQYKVIDGKTIYGPWSAVKAFKR